MTQRGYVRNIPGSPMCACAENMAVVTRADCTQVATTEKTNIVWSPSDSSLVANVDIRDINYNACTGQNANNNLFERVRKLVNDGQLGAEKQAALNEVLVGSAGGQCNAAVESFLGTKGITKIAA